MQLHYYTYSTPFRRPFITASNTFHKRKGIIAVLKLNGIQALGEAAPLPGFSTESLGDVLNQLQTEQGSIHSFLQATPSIKELSEFLDRHSLVPSLQFCLFSLVTSYQAQYRQKTLQHTVFDNARDCVGLNAVIDLSNKNIIESVGQHVADGYQTIKIKAGADTQQILSQIQQVRHTFPNINLRLDANQSWTPDEAIRVLNSLSELDLEYCEEPIQSPNNKTLERIRRHTSVPIALDESLGTTFTIEEASAMSEVLIIKPMVLGLLLDKLTGITERGDAKIVFTSSLETAIGRLMTATLASGLAREGTAQGLATGGFITEDLWKDHHFIRDGHFKLPEASQLPSLFTSDLTALTLQKLKP